MGLLLHFMLVFSQTLPKRTPRKNFVHIPNDWLRVSIELYPIHGQPPEYWRDSAIHQRKIVAEKKRFGRKNIGTGHDTFLKDFPCAGGLPFLHRVFDLFGQGVPVFFYSVQRQAKLRTCDGVHGH